MDYLEHFRRKLERRWKGSLISVAEAREIEPNAKKYLSELAAAGEITKVSWGWYWIADKYRDFFDFLGKDKHFKVLQKQSAAAFWNGDFIHRESYSVAVRDRSYARALRSFASLQGWKVEVEAREFQEGEYGRMQGLPVEALEETIVDCVKEWAFADAFASIFQNHKAVDWDRISKHYWERIPRSNVRVGQVLKYGEAIMDREPERPVRSAIPDGFVSRQVEEAAQRVIELA
jgi:hypothetical protein